MVLLTRGCLMNITTDFIGNVKKRTRNKGRSKLFFPENYTLLDLETTGYDPKWDRIIEIGAIKVRNNVVTKELNSLVKYDKYNDIPEEVEEMTGITEQMINDEGVKAETVIKDIRDFINDDIVVGFNVNFDINFMYDSIQKYFNEEFSNDYVDVLRIARKFYPEERHNRLIDCMERMGETKKQSHRGLSDCYDTKSVLDYFYRNKSESLLLSFKKRKSHRVDLTSLNPMSEYIDQENPFYQSNVCFTGKLDTLVRKDAAQLIVNLGGKAQNSITQQTNYLVLGDTAYSLHGKGKTTSKLKRAQDMIISGRDIKIINEGVFIDMLNDRLDEIGE